MLRRPFHVFTYNIRNNHNSKKKVQFILPKIIVLRFHYHCNNIEIVNRIHDSYIKFNIINNSNEENIMIINVALF